MGRRCSPALALVLACSCELGAAARLDGLFALFQHSVQLHGPPSNSKAKAAAPANHRSPAKYLVHNTESKLAGMGVLYRTDTKMNSIAGQDQYAAWGDTVEGITSAPNWLKVDNRYLPIKLNNVQVLVPLKETREDWKTTYEPTEVRRPDGSWAPCNITGVGAKPETYNLFVAQPKQGNETSARSGELATYYPMNNIPAAMLKQVSPMKVRVLVPQKRADSTRKWADGYVQLKVIDLSGTKQTIRVMRKSPMHVVRRVVCAPAYTSPIASSQDCYDRVELLSMGRKVLNSQHVWELGLKNGDVLEMKWPQSRVRKPPTRAGKPP